MIAPVVPVRRTDRIADVVARDAGLIEVFVQHSPHFAKLRSPTLRRTMGRLVTVEQAAQIAGISTEQLLCDLNAALGLERACEQDSAGGRLPESDLHHADGGAPPVPGAREVELDVREDLRCGREPFSRIMAAVAALAEGEILRLRAPFRPVPLFSVLAKRGFAHHERAEPSGDWLVWCYRRDALESLPTESTVLHSLDAGSVGASASSVAGGASNREGEPSEVWLDVRGLEPPEPMVRTLAALEQLPTGCVLVQVNTRIPQFVLPILAERGYAADVREEGPNCVLVRIRRSA